jgi:hypothetical protein
MRRGFAIALVAFLAGGVQRWTQERPNSEITTRLWVDGVEATGLRGVCKTSRCPIEPQWSIESLALPPGSHTARVKTTDGLGRSTETTRNFQVARDGIKPTLEAGGELINAPEGWVEQETYGLNATATDSASGVTSITFKIDSKQVVSTSQSCPEGGCKETLSKQVSLAAYSGGSHAAEVTATDGAGNMQVKRWTINVDPQGHISPPELENTLEAVESTSDAQVVNYGYEGTEGPAVSVAPTNNGFSSDGSYVPTFVPGNPAGAVRMEPVGNASEATQSAVPPQQISVTPVSGEAGASEAVALVEDTAVGAANTGNSSDTVIRPVYDGALTFQNIRDQSAAEEYSWEVHLPIQGEYMTLVDPQHVEVYFAGGHPAFSIAAIAASDAVGTTVPTSLKLAGNVVTEYVHHRSASFVYPVVVGVGWEGGYITNEIPGPKDEMELREEREQREREEREGLLQSQYWETEELTVGPPEPISTGEATASDAAASDAGGQRKEYVRVRCGHTGVYEPTNPSGSVCGNPFKGTNGENEMWNMAIRGAFFYRPAVEVYEKGAIGCDQSGRDIDIIWIWYVKEAYQCHYGPKTSDQNGGAVASAGHYLRAQAHWELGHRAQCGDNCNGTPNPAVWEDRAMELHLWPSGAVDVIHVDP